MSTEIPSEDETVLELNQFHLSPEVKNAIQSLSTIMECSPGEIPDMNLREHFFYPDLRDGLGDLGFREGWF